MEAWLPRKGPGAALAHLIPTCNQTIACWYEAAGTDARRMELKFANS